MNYNKYIEKSVWKIDFGEITPESKHGPTKGMRPSVIIHSGLSRVTAIPLTTSKFHCVNNKTYEVVNGLFSVPLYQDITTVHHNKIMDTFYGIMNDEKYNEIIDTYYEILKGNKHITSELMFDPNFDKDEFNNRQIDSERITEQAVFNIDELSSVSFKKGYLQFAYTIVYSLYTNHISILNIEKYLERKMDNSIGMYFNENFIVIRKNAHKVISSILYKNRNMTSDRITDLSSAFVNGARDGYILTNPLTRYPEFNYIKCFNDSNPYDIFIIINLNKLNEIFLSNGIDRSYMIDSIKTNIKNDIIEHPDYKKMLPQMMINDILGSYEKK